VDQVLAAVVTTIGLIVVALIEKDRRASKKRWQENKDDHNFVVDKIENLGKSLGISIDRVERGVERTEKKLDNHIRDHAKGEFD
jgi:hypothetical protein